MHGFGWVWDGWTWFGMVSNLLGSSTTRATSTSALIPAPNPRTSLPKRPYPRLSFLVALMQKRFFAGVPTHESVISQRPHSTAGFSQASTLKVHLLTKAPRQKQVFFTCPHPRSSFIAATGIERAGSTYYIDELQVTSSSAGLTPINLDWVNDVGRRAPGHQFWR